MRIEREHSEGGCKLEPEPVLVETGMEKVSFYESLAEPDPIHYRPG